MILETRWGGMDSSWVECYDNLKMSALHHDLSVLIPTRNESLNIAQCIRRVLAACPGAEVIVVDGGSDDTGKIVAELAETSSGIRYFRNEQDRGKGHAVRVAIELATRPILVQIDADLQFYPEEIEKLVCPLREDAADVVMGSRFHPRSIREPGSTPQVRTFGNKLISFQVSLLSGQRMTDVLAGMKAWRRDVTRRCALLSDTYSYEIEIPIKALRAGFRITEVPIRTAPRREGASSVSPFRAGLNLILDGLRFSLTSA